MKTIMHRALFAFACAITTPALAASYSVTDLGYLISPYAVNNNADILAAGMGANFIRSAGGSIQYLTVPYGGYPTPGPQASPTGGMNNSGVVVGDSQGVAARWVNGTPTQLGGFNLCCGLTQSGRANSINTSGQIVGWATRADSTQQAVLWQPDGSMIDLGVNPYSNGYNSAATGINTSGQIVGTKGESGGYTRAFLWANGTAAELGTLGTSVSSSASSIAVAINDMGYVVGDSQAWQQWGGAYHAFIWKDGVMTDLGSLSAAYGSNARGINKLNQVVGISQDDLGTDRPFLWQSGVMSDLNSMIDPSSGWALSNAISINDQGEIVGSGYLNGQWHGYLPAPVPEPSNMALMAIGVGLLGLVRLAHPRRP